MRAAADRFRPGRAATEADEVLKLLFGRKDGAGRDADLLRHRALEQFERSDLGRQFHPQHVAADGSRDLRPFGKIFRDCLRHQPHLLGINPAQSPDVVIVSAVGQKFRDGHLHQRGRADAADKLQMLHPGFEPTRSRPPHPRTGREGFGK